MQTDPIFDLNFDDAPDEEWFGDLLPTVRNGGNAAVLSPPHVLVSGTSTSDATASFGKLS